MTDETSTTTATAATEGRPKKLLNSPEDGVAELIEGLLYTYPHTLRKLENHNVLLSSSVSSVSSSRVALVSGGGSGHEPAHAGYVGDGMLTAAVLGGVFASPSVASVAAAVRAACGETGCLLIVKNYTGDRLNFGAARERCRAEGANVEMVVVGDDRAAPRSRGKNAGDRGVAGTLFVHKVAGAAAARGASLTEVRDAARLTAARLGSLGVALGSVTLPGAAVVNDRLRPTDGTMEVGLGIHGEAGMRRCPLTTADEAAKEMVDTIVEYGYGADDQDVRRIKSGDELAIMVNNLGGLSNFEMAVLTRGVVRYLENEKGCRVSRVYSGTYMTSFDMQGVSVSLLVLDDGSKDNVHLGTYLDDDTAAPAWTKAEVRDTSVPRPSFAPVPEVIPASAEDASSAPDVVVEVPDFAATARAAVDAVCAALRKAEPDLTAWDTVVGDGDCGLTVARGAAEISARAANGGLDFANPVALFAGVARAVSDSMGGTSGVLTELFFDRAAAFLRSIDGGVVDRRALGDAFRAGVDAVASYGGAVVGDRTMLDALSPAADAMPDLGAAADAARAGAAAAADADVARAGRSSYLGEGALKGTPDPGAAAVAIALEAAAAATR